MQASAQQGAPPGADGKPNGLPVAPPPPSAFRDSPALGLGRSVWSIYAVARQVAPHLGGTNHNCFSHCIR